MDATLGQILQELYQQDMEIQRLRAELAKATAAPLPVPVEPPVETSAAAA